MSYLDDDYLPEYEGCPVCHSPSTDTWVEVPEDDPKYKELYDPLRCKNCGVYFDFAQQYFDELFLALAEDLEPLDLDPIDDDWQLSEKERSELEARCFQSQVERLKASGFMDEDGELTDAYYREADFQYDCWSERHYL